MFNFLRWKATFIVDPKDVSVLFQKDFASMQMLNARANGERFGKLSFRNGVCLFVGALNNVLASKCLPWSLHS